MAVQRDDTPLSQGPTSHGKAPARAPPVDARRGFTFPLDHLALRRVADGTISMEEAHRRNDRDFKRFYGAPKPKNILF